tara:strand:+ start:595 stop:957 length:363 start_codon:yes stop_codon:yes gene_type:complete
MVERIGVEALRSMLSGHVKEDVTCVIKFYSSGCPYCDFLKPDYESISEQYDDIHFFALNIDDGYEAVQEMVPINGVPTILLIETGSRTKVTILEDPESPHPEKWYYFKYIKNFIDKETKR